MSAAERLARGLHADAATYSDVLLALFVMTTLTWPGHDLPRR